MGTDESYNGWTNRETWAVALHINNDQDWQASVLDALREAEFTTLADVLPQSDPSLAWTEEDEARHRAGQAGEIIRDNVENVLCLDGDAVDGFAFSALKDIGSLWRVNWNEIGASFLEDISDES